MTEFRFGRKSVDKLLTCDPSLRTTAELALDISPVDITIVHGFRGEQLQNRLVEQGASKTPWPQSKHNRMVDGQPRSQAIDFAPWVNGGIPWHDTHLFAMIAGVMFAAASEVGVTLRWGGDWDMDGLTIDHTFLDWGHIELA